MSCLIIYSRDQGGDVENINSNIDFKWLSKMSDVYYEYRYTIPYQLWITP